MIRASALSIRARNLMLVDYALETAYVCSIRAGDLHLELVPRGGTSGTWRLTNSGRDGERDMSTADQLAASLSAVLRVAAAENAGTVTVRLVDCPSSVIVIPQHEWPAGLPARWHARRMLDPTDRRPADGTRRCGSAWPGADLLASPSKTAGFSMSEIRDQAPEVATSSRTPP